MHLEVPRWFFNLGCALSYVQTLSPGIYITMQGEYFKWNEVKKNPKKGIFERTLINYPLNHILYLDQKLFR